MAIGRPKLYNHDVRLKMSKVLHRNLTFAARKARRTLPDFIRLVLEDAVNQPGDKLPDSFTHLKPIADDFHREIH